MKGLVVFCTIVLVAFGVACSSAPAASTEPIKFALIGPLTGTNAVLGEWQKKGYLLVFDEVNNAGGIKGRPIRYQIEDDGADPNKAVNIAQKVITQDKVVAAMATPNSTPALGIVPIFAQYKVPHLTPALNVDITNKGSQYVFRTAPAGSAYENTLVDFLVAQGYKKYAIISDTSAFGKGEGDYQEAALLRNGNLKATTRELYAIEDQDFKAQITKIMQGNPDVLLIAGSEVAAGLIAKQIRGLGFKGIIAGGTALGTPSYIQSAGGTAAEGTIFASPYITPDVNPVAQKWADKYKARWNEDLESHGAQAIDGANMFVTAATNAYPNITSDTIAAELRKINNMQGIQGMITVDQKGETLTKTYIGIIKNGKLVPYSGK